MKKWQTVLLTVMPGGFIILGGIIGYKIWRTLRQEKKQQEKQNDKNDKKEG